MQSTERDTIQFPISIVYGDEEALEETAMEVAADPTSPFPAPHLKHLEEKTKKSLAKLGTSRRVTR